LRHGMPAERPRAGAKPVTHDAVIRRPPELES
jgi:hypothetical protein